MLNQTGKRHWKKPLWVFAIFFSFFFAVPSFDRATFQSADAKFNQKLYREALERYQKIYENAEGEAKLRAFYRIVECLALLFQYEKAKEAVEQQPLPKDPLWKARLLILKSEVYRQYLQEYGFPAISGAESEAQESPEAIKQKIEQAFEALEKLKSFLVKRPLKKESYFILFEEETLKEYPTLWDFVVLRRTDDLLKKRAERKPQAQVFFRDQLPKPKKDDPPILLAGALMEEAAELNGTWRKEAVERWHLKRLWLPVEHPGLVRWSKDPVKDFERGIRTLKRWQRKFQTEEGKALAGFTEAWLYEKSDHLKKASRTCRSVFKNFPRTEGARRCQKLRARIQRPELKLEVKYRPPQGYLSFVSTRNLKAVFFHLYRTSPDELMQIQPKQYLKTWSQVLNRPDPKTILTFLEKKKPVRSWKEKPELKKSKTIHHWSSWQVTLPKLKPGVYLLVASNSLRFQKGKDLISAVIFNQTNLLLIGTAGFEASEEEMLYDPEKPTQKAVNAFHFYLLDAENGRPVQDGDIDLWLYPGRGGWKARHLKTNGEGMAKLQVPVDLHPSTTNSYSVDPLAKKGEMFAYWQSPAYLSFRVPDPVKVYVDIDRPIYRPGQKVKIRVTVLERTAQGFQIYKGKNSVSVRLLDPNRKEVFQTEGMLSDWGSFKTEFTIPEGRLLGDYQILAELETSGKLFQGSKRFAVEEYKRPEFEVKIKEAKEPFRYGVPAEIEGEVTYFFGAPVSGAHLLAVVKRIPFFPVYSLWWSPRFPNPQPEEILRKELKADPKGRFAFSFVPQPPSPESDLPSRFIVKIEARDPGGRTIVATQTFLAGKNAYLFNIQPEAGFFWSDKPVRIQAELRNIQGQLLEGKASYAVHRLPHPPDESDAGRSAGFESPSLDLLYRYVENGPKVQDGNISFKGLPATILLPPLPSGIYRLTLKADDPWGTEIRQTKTFAVVDARTKMLEAPLPAVTMAEHTTVSTGETARLLIGSSKLTEPLYLEIWGGPFLLARTRFKADGIKVFELPIREKHKGGVTLRWFGARHKRLYGGTVTLQVPWRDKKLSVRLQHEKVLRPGQKATWKLFVSDSRGKPVEAEAFLTMFDRSLEYYLPYGSLWTESLYSFRRYPLGAHASQTSPQESQLPIESGWIKEILKLYQAAIHVPWPPRLRLTQSRIIYTLRARELEEAAAPLEKKEAPSNEKAHSPKGEGAKAPLDPRKAFLETAFFKPQLAVRNGTATIAFRVPEQLTGWRILGFVLTKDLKVASISEKAITKKEVVVRVEIPRFFREGDRGTIKAVVHNETKRALSGKLMLSILQDKEPAGQLFQLKDSVAYFELKPHRLKAFSWSVVAPEKASIFLVRAAVQAAHLSDAEQRRIFVLPSRERLVESVVQALQDSVTKTLELPTMKQPDPTRENELAVLQIEPQLALTVLSSIPFLVEYPYACVEQTLHRFVPLAILHEIYTKHEKLAKIVARLPERKSIIPSWNRNDPLRLIKLMETPWLSVSEGVKSLWPLIQIFNPDAVEQRKNEALAELRAAQLPSGAFPWFPGGQPDPYITLLVLDGLAQAKQYGVSLPEDMAGKALQYLMAELPKKLKPDPENLSLILYAAYVVTRYPRDFPGSDRALTFARLWLQYAERYADALTPLGRGYAAYIYWSLGDKKKAKLYLARAMDGAREDPTTGLYFAPEKKSWLWFRDTVEKHAFLLRMLQEMQPDDPRIEGMVKWLLFNRKANVWKSTKATAQAIYALLEFMERKGVFESKNRFTIQWGDRKESVEVEPFSWFERPFSWQEKAFKEAKKLALARISKKGPGLAFASLTWVYSTSRPQKASRNALLRIERKYYLKTQKGSQKILKPLSSGDAVSVGDQVEVHLTISTASAFEYVHIKDPKPSGFEAESLRSGWRFDRLAFYEEPRDSLTNFFISWLPHGEYTLRYRLRPTLPGKYHIPAAVLQSMYAPEFAAHSASFELRVVD